MPWLEMSLVEQRERFIDDHRLGLYDMTELCARYAISRKTGYKWVARDDGGGRPALLDRSRAPHHCPHKIAEAVAQLLLTARRRHPDWGPEKLLQWLEPRHPGVAWPAISTAGDLLARHGLVKKRRRRFDRLVREYGLPRAIRTDNGVPFASTSLHGLTPLNVWWLRLGIQHQRIRPANPQQNGAHERMHKTLKRGAIRPPRANLVTQQRAFHRFRQEYNHERPHQFLGGRTPGSRYRPSTRLYTGALPALEYPDHLVVTRVTNAGTIRFKTRLLYVSTALKQHRIGLEEVDDGIWSVFFCDVLLGRIDERQALVRGQLGVTHVPG